MDYFKEKKSKKFGKIYYQNKITGESQWGTNTFFNTGKQLPKGWIRLDFEGQQPVYKYIGNLYSMPYKDLLTKEDSEDKAEAFRRYTLFEKVADLLKLTSESICDESLQYLANQAHVSVDDIISYIERKESEDLQENANLTAFQRIRQTDDSFLTERSIRELCGVNMRDSELSEAMNQLDQLCCHIDKTIIKDPVMCSSGHTYEREAIEKWLRDHRSCPDTNEPITDVLIPNHALRNVLDDFVKKYKNQRGEIWKPIRDECDSYQDFMRTVGRYNPRPVSPEPYYLSVETLRALSLLPDPYIDPRLESWENMSARYENFYIDFYDTFGIFTSSTRYTTPTGNRAHYENSLRGNTRFVILPGGDLLPSQQVLHLTPEQYIQRHNVVHVLERCNLEIHSLDREIHSLD